MILTKEKSAFAAENHGLVYSFLKERGLPEDEYYDTVIFAFLGCVMKDTDGDFKTRAYAKMDKAAALADSGKEENIISLFCNDGYYRSIEETLADETDETAALLERIRLNELLSCFEMNEREIVALLLEGFEPAEISFRLKKPYYELEGIMNNIRAKAAVLLPSAA